MTLSCIFSLWTWPLAETPERLNGDRRKGYERNNFWGRIWVYSDDRTAMESRSIRITVFLPLLPAGYHSLVKLDMTLLSSPFDPRPTLSEYLSSWTVETSWYSPPLVLQWSWEKKFWLIFTQINNKQEVSDIWHIWVFWNPPTGDPPPRG